MTPPAILPTLLAWLPVAAFFAGFSAWGNYRRTNVWSWTYALALLVCNSCYLAFLLVALVLLGGGWFAVVVVGAIAGMVANRARPWAGQVTTVKAQPTARPRDWNEDQLP